MRLARILSALGLFVSFTWGITVDVEDEGALDQTSSHSLIIIVRQRLTISSDSLKEAAGEYAWGLVKFYSGNETGDVPGNLPAPYYCESQFADSSGSLME